MVKLEGKGAEQQTGHCNGQVLDLYSSKGRGRSTWLSSVIDRSLLHIATKAGGKGWSVRLAL